MLPQECVAESGRAIFQCVPVNDYNKLWPRGKGVLCMDSPELFHIAVTDINHHVRSFLQRELAREGYSVRNFKTGNMVYQCILNTAPLDLIIIDPEVFHHFDQNLVTDILRIHPSLQIIIHTYADTIGEIQPGKNIHLVEKNGKSIARLRTIIRLCFNRFKERKAA